MKIFNTVTELWKYCAHCAACNENSREIILNIYTAYPAACYLDKSQSDFQKDKIIGSADYYVNNKFKRKIYFNIDETKNSISFEGLNPLEIKNMNPGFYMGANCHCGKSGIMSFDIKINMDTLKICTPITLESEFLYIDIETGFMIDIDQDYDQNKTYIRKIKVMDDGTYNYMGVTFIHNLLDIDLSNTAKAFKRIQTILTFN